MNQPRHPGNLNPLRYRGYRYDAEIGLYWLQTRFYDPEIGRFINADAQLNDGLFGNNLYAYCGNDPVNQCDCTGTCSCIAGDLFDCSACRRAKLRIKEVVGTYTRQYISNALETGYSYLSSVCWKVVDGEKGYTVVTNIYDSSYANLIYSYNYRITESGIVRFSLGDLLISIRRQILDYSDEVALTVFDTAKFINPTFLSKRTVHGIATELEMHLRIHLITSGEHSETADMGNVVEFGETGYDSNAKFFEWMAKLV